MSRRNGAKNLYETGRWLFALVIKAPVPDMTIRLLSSLTGLTENRCSRSLRVYRHFKDRPELLEHLSVPEVIHIIEKGEQPRRQTY